MKGFLWWFWFSVIFVGVMLLSVRIAHRLQAEAAAAQELFRVRCEQAGGVIVPRNVGTFLGGSSYLDDCVLVQKQ
jgi:hypothetical protein